MNVLNLKLFLYSGVGLDRSPQPRQDLLALAGHLPSLASIALNVFLNATWKVKYGKEVGHLTKSVGHTQSTLVNHLKSVMLKNLIKHIFTVFNLKKFNVYLGTLIHLYFNLCKRLGIW